MYLRPIVNILICFFLIISLQAFVIKQDISVVPFAEQPNSYDVTKLLLLSVSKNIGNDLIVSSQWQAEKVIPIASPSEKEKFPKEFIQIFPPNITIEELAYSFLLQGGSTKPETLRYKYIDTLTVRGFWQKAAFSELLRLVQVSKASELVIKVKGWKDNTVTTDYDDPIKENYSLYKLQTQLIPGDNKIYFSSGGNKAKAVMFRTTQLAESKPVADRSERFHNSEYEQNCTSCHDGLPSGNGGEDITADCLSCHKAFTQSSNVHGPVEMKECSSCHSWSKENKAVVVEKGVPGVCADCHSEVTDLAEKSKFPHAVGSDCLSCHSPHSSNETKLLKDKVYNTCILCHDKYGLNHPVSNHPGRFKSVSETDKTEISCVSCHNPHGSDNKAMMKVAGGRMAICLNCHNK